MTGVYNYDRLPTVHELQDQDITDVNEKVDQNQWTLEPHDSQTTLRPLSFSDYSSIDQHDINDRSSVRSIETSGSSSSGSSFSKFKNLGARIRRKPLPRYLKGSIRRHAAADIAPVRIGRGVWKDQLLSDRSLRGMAALTTAFAIGLTILVISYAKPFNDRANLNTTSVGGEVQSCKRVAQTNTVLLLLINTCATMVLGMSNTYQQLVTSLKINDLKHALSKFGDSRVGTNSPFSIKHKKTGKKRAWAAWCLLIMTSMPIHFLANSLVGPSYTQELPTVVDFDAISNVTIPSGYSVLSPTVRAAGGKILDDRLSFPCWSAFRTGKPHFPRRTDVLSEASGLFGSSQDKFDTYWERIQVHYVKESCAQFDRDSMDIDLDTLEGLITRSPRNSYNTWYQEGGCIMGTHVACTLHQPQVAKCRLNVRMSAAFILMGCLIVKAIYMCAVNLLARGKVKEHCLTFGDVIVASASQEELKVKGECMVNAFESFRRLNSHTCHKHCCNSEESKTGDEIGHCQKCKKWNSNDKLSNQPQPTIATKFKKSLLSNLGNTALTQMCLLMFCSLALLGASLAMAVPMAMENEYYKDVCTQDYKDRYRPSECNLTKLERFDRISGGFGGFNHSLTIASLPPDSLANEFTSFSISNGAQFIYSLLYLLLIYNITLISQEYDWGQLEYGRQRIRSTLVAGSSFTQNYLLQLPKKILFPLMGYSVLTHWMLGEALQTHEAIWMEQTEGRYIEHSKYMITYAAYPLWIATFLILVMTGVCWWAFTYKREGFIPQMFGSIRVIMAATSQLDDFPDNGVQWGDLGCGKQFRHAGLSAEEVMKIMPNELYAGR